MTKFSIFLCGLLAGLLISHYFNQPKILSGSEKKSLVMDLEATSEIKPETVFKKNRPEMKSAESKKIDPQTAVQTDDIKKQDVNPAFHAEPKRQLELTISEELVRELEKNWYELRNQVQLANEKDGWRVQFVDPNSLFSRTGLQAGDFISQAAILNLKMANGDNNNLSDRVIRILNHVQ